MILGARVRILVITPALLIRGRGTSTGAGCGAGKWVDMHIENEVKLDFKVRAGACAQAGGRAARQAPRRTPRCAARSNPRRARIHVTEKSAQRMRRCGPRDAVLTAPAPPAGCSHPPEALDAQVALRSFARAHLHLQKQVSVRHKLVNMYVRGAHRVRWQRQDVDRDPHHRR